MKVNRLKLNDPSYPAVLRQIENPPKQLFWIGGPPSTWMDKPRVAIVGSRKATAYGREVTQRLAGQLAKAGVVIISGLALGVDSIAHRATLDAGGTTIAVLPTSLDKIYPASHYSLAKRIIQQGGALISEYPPGSEAFKVNFIARNRIVSGLADLLLITEAAANSGTIHTAGFALGQGKTVMAVPGNITSPFSEGCNNLIKGGAIPVTDASDVFFSLGIKLATKSKRVFRGTELEGRILDKITAGISSQEELALDLGLDAATINSALTSLEINGYVKPSGAGNWLAL